jgi:putative two-component system response regulator
VDYIIKPVSPPIVRARIQTHLQLSENQRGLEAQVFSRTSQLNESQAELLRTLARAGEFKDNETGEHVIRMSRYCRLLGLAAGLNEEDADLLMDVAPMHDIGKIGIADSILLHPGKLSAEQMRIIKRHPEIGTKILGTYDCPLLNAARIVTLTHHEKWDGTGYPNNLAGKEIPLFGRIAGIADVFDALTYDRPYKAAWPLERAIEHLNQEAGKHFDPRLVELFNGIIDEVIAVKNMYRG